MEFISPMLPTVYYVMANVVMKYINFERIVMTRQCVYNQKWVEPSRSMSLECTYERYSVKKACNRMFYFRLIFTM